MYGHTDGISPHSIGLRPLLPKKAFDTVDHGVLLAKLDHYGVRGGTLDLLDSYLRGRAQYVVLWWA